MIEKKYENYILDLGGVIINLDYQRTIDEFKKLGCQNFEELYSQATQSGLFDDFETGKISSQYFINLLKFYLPTQVSPNAIVHAWNAMILDFPIKKLEKIHELSQSCPVFLLSNTNELHIQVVRRKYKESNFKTPFEKLFTKIYLSHEIGMRKPNAEIFEHVCNDNGIDPQKTLFIDDTEQHILGAQKIGLNTVHLTKEKDLNNFLI